MRIRITLTVLLCLICLSQLPLLATAAPNLKPSAEVDLDQAIKLEIILDAPVDRVWRAWTTRDGIKSFFAPDCDIDLRVLGKYDILFAPSAPIGLRGAEGNILLAIQEGKMLSFTWDAPPMFPEIRKQRTSVVIKLVPIAENRTRLIFRHTGWGDGEEWKKVHDYFEMAWGDVVLPYLKHSLEVSPIDWKNPPKRLPKATRT